MPTSKNLDWKCFSLPFVNGFFPNYIHTFSSFAGGGQCGNILSVAFFGEEVGEMSNTNCSWLGEGCLRGLEGEVGGPFASVLYLEHHPFHDWGWGGGGSVSLRGRKHLKLMDECCS